MTNERSADFHRIVAHPVPDQPFTQKPDVEKILLTIGPEGGFLPSEVAAFEKNARLSGFGYSYYQIECGGKINVIKNPFAVCERYRIETFLGGFSNQ